MAKTSIIIPANGERFLGETITDLLAKATGDIEILAMLDGNWPEPPIPEHPKVIFTHFGVTRGMRACINAGARLAKGDYLMKIDAHCSITQGYDEILQAICPDNAIVIPRRGSLEPYGQPWGQVKPNGKPPVDAHFLSYPFEVGRAGVGLHGQVWNERARDRADFDFDEEMSSQGSCWYMRKSHWARLGEMDEVKATPYGNGYGNFVQEMQELGNKTWLGGGSMHVNKNVQYLHWHKGKEGRGYFIDKRQMSRGNIFCTRYWMNDGWRKERPDTKPLRWLIEHFWPVPGWPKDAQGALDWDAVERATAEYEAANAQ